MAHKTLQQEIQDIEISFTAIGVRAEDGRTADEVARDLDMALEEEAPTNGT